MLRDLGLRLERGDDDPHRIVIPAPPETRGPHGGVRAGILATGVDVVAATLALRSMSPDWLATADLSVWTRAVEQRGPISGEARLLRSGSTTTVIEVALTDLGSDARPVALSSTTFVRIKRPTTVGEEQSEVEPAQSAVVDFAGPESGMAVPFADGLGYAVVDAAAGVLELPRSEYTVNSFDSLQGGMVAMLVELAAEIAASSITGEQQGVLDLSVRYLAPGPSGPYRTRADALRIGPSGNLFRVEVLDVGCDRRMAVGSATAIATSR